VEQKYPSKGFYRVPGVYTFLPTKKWKKKATLSLRLRTFFFFHWKLNTVASSCLLFQSSRLNRRVHSGSEAFLITALSGKNYQHKSSHEKTHPCPIVQSKCSFIIIIPYPSLLLFLGCVCVRVCFRGVCVCVCVCLCVYLCEWFKCLTLSF
jgi:hypothetical protein